MTGQPSILFGEPSPSAAAQVILLHGRGQTTDVVVDIAQRIGLPGLGYRAVPAPEQSWYPLGFLAPLEDNQPKLGASRDRLDREIADLEAEGWSPERIVWLGFSQGACLAADLVHRRPRRWGALIAFTGGLLGPPGSSWESAADLAGLPVLLSNGDADPWVPWARTEETADVFRQMGAEVVVQQHPGREHLVLDAEIDAARAILRRLV